MAALDLLSNTWVIGAICISIALFVRFVIVNPKLQPKPTFLEPSIFKELPLMDKKVLSHNTRLFRYGKSLSFMSHALFLKPAAAMPDVFASFYRVPCFVLTRTVKKEPKHPSKSSPLLQVWFAY